ncbi:MAG TPA: HAMP domain-containing sensor histidine kinase [Cytophagales bacterium]|nr:HAMP domain-containing sensor histidine kinase [Cytophagales bacterium]
MRFLNQIKETFSNTEIDQLIIENEIKKNNLDRIFYLAIVATPVIFILVLWYYISLDAGSSVEHTWKSRIILIHSILCIILVIGGIFTYILKKQKKPGLPAVILNNITFLVVTLAGVATAMTDQLVTPSIAPFILSCTITALVILVRPFLAFLYFLISFIIIYIALSFTQHNQAVLLSNRLDALVAVGIGFILSLILWKVNMIRYRQSRLIEVQKKEIESNYEKLIKYADDLNIANAAKDKFFSIISHDLRGLITSTLSASDLLIDNDLTPEEKPRINQLLNARLKKTFKLLENLLTWSKSQVNQITYNPVRVNLYLVVQENIELLDVLAEEKNISLLNHVSVEFTVIADREMLDTVIRNLISNAIKFTNSNGKVEIDAKMSDGLTEKGEHFEVSIKDTGVGMTNEVMNNLFQIDKKVTTPGTKNEIGSGLGLILCKDFIEKQGGEILVTSVVGKGSCFTFVLPVSLRAQSGQTVE